MSDPASEAKSGRHSEVEFCEQKELFADEQPWESLGTFNAQLCIFSHSRDLAGGAILSSKGCHP